MAITMAKKLAMAGAGAAVIGLGVAVPAAFAQDPSPSPSSSASTPESDGDREQRHAQRQDKMAELLASELGIDKAKVAEALAKVEDQMRSDMKAEHQDALSGRLAEAVSEGKLTQEQADAILKASEAGVLPVGPGRMGHGR